MNTVLNIKFIKSYSEKEKQKNQCVTCSNVTTEDLYFFVKSCYMCSYFTTCDCAVMN